MTDQQLFVYISVFIAVVSIAVSIWGNFAEATRAAAERVDADRAVETKTEEIGPQLDRFVSRGRLFSLSLTFALIPFALVLGALILTGVSSKLAILLVPVVFGVIGWCLPPFYYKSCVRRRQAAFENDILDFVMGISNALQAGMALPQAIEKVGNQMKGPMKEELTIVLREYRLGIDLVQALDRMYRRMPCEDLKLLVCAAKLTTEAGGSLASVLGEMTNTIRGRREFADKVKALTAEGRFEAGAISCMPIVAFGLLYIINGEMMRPLYTTELGWLTLGGVVLLEVCGYLTIRKIVSIEI